MPVNMKEMIARAARTLLLDKNVKKLTVKNIVEECHITRQSFYYHFEDIPNLLQWMMQQGMEWLKIEARNQEGAEAALKFFFLVSINAKPYLRKMIQSNYGDEIARLMRQQIHQMFDEIIESEGLYQNLEEEEVKLAMRYHCNAIMGILGEWTEEDTQNLDQIVHEVYLLLMGKLTPFSSKKE